MAPRLRRFVTHLSLALVCVAAVAGCAAQQRPGLQVLSVESAARNQVLLIQVTNPERRSIRLQRLAFTFASSDHSSRGEVQFSRDIAAGGAVIVEVPVEFGGHGPFTLKGQLTALMDRIERTYPVQASVPGEPGGAAQP